MSAFTIEDSIDTKRAFLKPALTGKPLESRVASELAFGTPEKGNVNHREGDKPVKGTVASSAGKVEERRVVNGLSPLGGSPPSKGAGDLGEQWPGRSSTRRNTWIGVIDGSKWGGGHVAHDDNPLGTSLPLRLALFTMGELHHAFVLGVVVVFISS